MTALLADDQRIDDLLAEEPATALDGLLDSLPAAQRTGFVETYRGLARLPASDLNLPAFFDAYLQQVAALYAASAGALWFRGEGDAWIVKARVGFDRLGLTEDYAAAHDGLLRFAARQPRSLLVKPFSSPAVRSGVSNPTDSFVLLGPVPHQQEPLGVVELFLGPTPVRGRTAAERRRYVLWLDHLILFLCRGLERRFQTASPLAAARGAVAAARREVEPLRHSIRAVLENSLGMLVGKQLGSLAAHQALATEVQELLDAHGFRVACPECGAAAILRCQANARVPGGVFVFDHSAASRRTFHGGQATFPRLAIVERPPRRKLRDKTEPVEAKTGE